MLKINRKIEYGLIAIKHLYARREGQLSSAKDIAEAYGAPFDLLSKVLQRLQAKGIIRSVQGASGGYALGRDLKEISLAELIEALEGPVAVTACQTHGGLDACEMSGSCNIIPPMTHINNKIQQVLSGMTLAEITAPAAAWH